MNRAFLRGDSFLSFDSMIKRLIFKIIVSLSQDPTYQRK